MKPLLAYLRIFPDLWWIKLKSDLLDSVLAVKSVRFLVNINFTTTLVKLD